jgi:hypothetical protein
MDMRMNESREVALCNSSPAIFPRDIELPYPSSGNVEHSFVLVGKRSVDVCGSKTMPWLLGTEAAAVGLVSWLQSKKAAMTYRVGQTMKEAALRSWPVCSTDSHLCNNSVCYK